MLLGAIAGTATVFAIGFGTLLGVVVLIAMGRTGEQTPARVTTEAVVAAEATATAPSSRDRVALETVAAPPVPGQPPPQGDPITVMLRDVRYERRLAEPPPPAPSPPKGFFAGIWEGVLDALGFTAEPPPPTARLAAAIEGRQARDRRVRPAAPAPTARAIERKRRPPARGATAAPAEPPPAPVPAIPPREAEEEVPRASEGTLPPPSPRPSPLPTGPLDLSDEGDDFDPFDESFDVADQFIAPVIDEEPAMADESVSELDAMDMIFVQIRLDTEDVPVTVDGREMRALAFPVAPGPHRVELYYKGQTSAFDLVAQNDPEEWCFERKGRDFRQTRCGQR